MSMLPLFLNLTGRRVVLVGGGAVAADKLRHLVSAGADITVIAPVVCEAVASAGVPIERRPFAPEDLDSAWLVVAAAPREVNRRVAEAAEARRIFANVVDDPELASAYAAAVLRRGDFTLAVSTGGAAPALAALMRDALAAVIPSDVDTWTREAHRLRRSWIAAGVPMSQRKPLLLEALIRMYGSQGRPEGRPLQPHNEPPIDVGADLQVGPRLSEVRA
jgi:uroporphyrin-III C-methyltransferase/precorrin-2 dehydrogenase/sirohydrochlorin ferrochelatase